MRDRLRALHVESDGGPNRATILRELDERPLNTNQLAEQLGLNYNTVRHHLRVLREYGVIDSDGASYGEQYFLTEQFDRHYDSFDLVIGELDESYPG